MWKGPLTTAGSPSDIRETIFTVFVSIAFSSKSIRPMTGALSKSGGLPSLETNLLKLVHAAGITRFACQVQFV